MATFSVGLGFVNFGTMALQLGSSSTSLNGSDELVSSPQTQLSWGQVRAKLLEKLRQTKYAADFNNQLSPASTAREPTDCINSEDQMVEYLIDLSLGLSEPPLTLPRLYEVVSGTNKFDCRALRDIERILSSSRCTDGPSIFLSSSSPFARSLRRPYP